MKSSLLTLRSPPRRGSASYLAERLERFCEVGIGYRATGVCVEPGVSARAHQRHGHDAGCSTLGVPRHAIALALRFWDDVGAAPLLLEAIDEAINSLSDTVLATEASTETAANSRQGTTVWSAQLARECVAYAIRIRITPAQ